MCNAITRPSMAPMLLALLLGAGCGTPPNAIKDPPRNWEDRDDLAHLYDSLQLEGTFLLHDAASDRWTSIDSAGADLASSPASTFKVLGTLIGLETGVLSGPDHVLAWDGQDRGRPEINEDLDLREAYRTSAYWY